jgi:phosphoserine phosphatase
MYLLKTFKILVRPAAIMSLFVFLFLPIASFAHEYKTIQKIEEAYAELSSADKDSLVIFDVDNVLITAISAIRRPIGESLREHLSEKYFRYRSEMKQQELQSIMWLQGKSRLVEAEILSVIQDLQKRKVPSIALTALGSGKFGRIENMGKYRIEQLDRLGIHFRPIIPQTEMLFTELVEENGSYPQYREGILFTNWFKNNKGVVLLSFLKKSNLNPRKIIFFDDVAANLDTVRVASKGLNIEFVGIQYSASSLSNDHLDPNRAELQFKHLCSHKQWLDDSEIDQIINIQSEVK